MRSVMACAWPLGYLAWRKATPLQRIIAINLTWRLGVQIPVFVLYKALDR